MNSSSSSSSSTLSKYNNWLYNSLNYYILEPKFALEELKHFPHQDIQPFLSLMLEVENVLDEICTLSISIIKSINISNEIEIKDQGDIKEKINEQECVQLNLKAKKLDEELKKCHKNIEIFY